MFFQSPYLQGTVPGTGDTVTTQLPLQTHRDYTAALKELVNQFPTVLVTN